MRRGGLRGGVQFILYNCSPLCRVRFPASSYSLSAASSCRFETRSVFVVRILNWQQCLLKLKVAANIFQNTRMQIIFSHLECEKGDKYFTRIPYIYTLLYVCTIINILHIFCMKDMFFLTHFFVYCKSACTEKRNTCKTGKDSYQPGNCKTIVPLFLAICSFEQDMILQVLYQ